MYKISKYGNINDSITFKFNKKIWKPIIFRKRNKKLIDIIFNDIKSLDILKETNHLGFHFAVKENEQDEFKPWLVLLDEKDDKVLHCIFSLFDKRQLRTLLNIYEQELSKNQFVTITKNSEIKLDNENLINNINTIIKTIKNIFKDFERITIYTAIIMSIASVATAIANIVTLAIKSR